MGRIYKVQGFLRTAVKCVVAQEKVAAGDKSFEEGGCSLG